MMHYHMGKEDPMGYYYGWFHTDPAKPWNGYAPIGTKDPFLDKLLDAVAEESDFTKRKEKFKEVVLYVQDKVLLIPYLSPVNASVWSTKLKGMDPLKYFHVARCLREAWLET
jgi:ABC-type transport system substrate-binding protein